MNILVHNVQIVIAVKVLSEILLVNMLEPLNGLIERPSHRSFFTHAVCFMSLLSRTKRKLRKSVSFSWSIRDLQDCSVQLLWVPEENTACKHAF